MNAPEKKRNAGTATNPRLFSPVRSTLSQPVGAAWPYWFAAPRLKAMEWFNTTIRMVRPRRAGN
jgi:hypothetical protein